MDKIKRYYEENKKIINVALIGIGVGIAIGMFGKKCYMAGYVAAIAMIMDKNEGKIINF